MTWTVPDDGARPQRLAVGQIWHAHGVYVEVEALEPAFAVARSFLTGQLTPLPYTVIGDPAYRLALESIPEPGPSEPPVPPPGRWRAVDWGAIGHVLLVAGCALLTALGAAVGWTFLLTK